jgi:hypothetical protein
MQDKSLNDFFPNKLTRESLFNITANNGNIEVLARRTAIERSLNINLSSIASGIIDFEVLPEKTRRGVIGVLQTPIVLVGPFSYTRRKHGNYENTFAPLALISARIPVMASKLALVTYNPEKILASPVKIDEISILKENPVFQVLITSLASASAIKLGEFFSCLTREEKSDKKLIECVEIDSLLFETNPTVVDIAKIVTGDEEPDISSYERKIRDTVELITRLFLISRELFQ